MKKKVLMMIREKNIFIDMENYAIVKNALYCNFYEKVIGNMLIL